MPVKGRAFLLEAFLFYLWKRALIKESAFSYERYERYESYERAALCESLKIGRLVRGVRTEYYPFAH